MSEDVRPKRWKRWLKRALLAFLVLLIVALIVHQVWNYRAGKALQRELDAIRAAGDPLTLDELWPPEIEPKSENAAYLYRAAFNLLEAAPEEFEDLWSRVDLEPDDWSEQTVAEIKTTVKAAEEALRLAERAIQMGRCQFRVRFTYEDHIPTDHLGHLRNVSRLLRLRALLKLRAEDVAAALEDCRKAYMSSRAVTEEPFLVSYLIRSAIIRGSLDTMQRVLRDHQPSREFSHLFLRDLADDLARLRLHLVRSYKGGRVLFLMLSGPMSGRWDMMPKRFRAVREYFPYSQLTTFLLKPAYRSRDVRFLQEIRDVLRMAEADYAEVQPEIQTWRDDIDTEQFAYIIRSMRPLRGPLTELVKPFPFGDFLAYLKARENVATAEAWLTLARAALALKSYKASHGAYPEAVAALSPTYLQELPRDPFTGRDLVYVREGDGFLLYSVGVNLQDEGGSSGITPDDEPFRVQDDIAWRCAR